MLSVEEGGKRQLTLFSHSLPSEPHRAGSCQVDPRSAFQTHGFARRCLPAVHFGAVRAVAIDEIKISIAFVNLAVEAGDLPFEIAYDDFILIPTVGGDRADVDHFLIKVKLLPFIQAFNDFKIGILFAAGAPPGNDQADQRGCSESAPEKAHARAGLDRSYNATL